MTSLSTDGELRLRNRLKSVPDGASLADKSRQDSDARESALADSSSAAQPTEDTEDGADNNSVDSTASSAPKKGISAALMQSRRIKWFKAKFPLSFISKTAVIILALALTVKTYNYATLKSTRAHVAACEQHLENGYLQNTEICLDIAKNSSIISMSSLDEARMQGQIGELSTKFWFQDQKFTMYMSFAVFADAGLTWYYLWSLVKDRSPFKGLILYSAFQYLVAAWKLRSYNKNKNHMLFWGWLFQKMAPNITDAYREAIGTVRYNLVFPVIGYCVCKFIVAFYCFLSLHVIRSIVNKDDKTGEKRKGHSNTGRKMSTGWFLIVVALVSATATTSILVPLSKHLTPQAPAITYESFNKELDDAAKALQVDPYFILSDVRSTAVKLWRKGESGDAEKMLRQVLHGYESWVGSQHNLTMVVVQDLAQAVHKLRRYPEAEVLQRRLLQGYKSLFGEDHSKTIHVMLELAFALHEQGKFEESIEWRYKVLKWQGENLGPESLEAMVSLDNLGNSMAALKNYEGAATFLRRALAGKRNTLGDNHPQTITSLHHLGLALAGSKEYEEAEEVFQSVLQRRERVLGSEDLNTLDSAHVLGAVLNALGRRGESEHMLRRALHGRSKLLGNHHPQTQTTLKLLTNILAKQGRNEDVDRLVRSQTRDY